MSSLSLDEHVWLCIVIVVGDLSCTEFISSFLSFLDPLGHLVSDIVLSSHEVLVHTVMWGLEVNAMSACLAVNPLSFHGSLAGEGVLELDHTGVLPWVFTSVQEVDVVSFDVEAAIEAVDLSDGGRRCEITEDFSAVILPVVIVKGNGSHWVETVGDLEPAELGAVLVGPLSACFAGIDLCF